MADKQNTSISKNSSLLSISAFSKKLHTKAHNTTCRKSVYKTSVEELAEEGYIFGRVLGEGSYSKVKSVMFQGREIAVKILKREQLTTDFETKFLPRELEILSKVKHPNIVHVYKIYRYPKKIYIFMELIQNGDLLNYIREHNRLVEFEAHNFFKQIVSAILYLHNLNIAHRDLKCENIMINANEEIKVIDFGFCRPMENKSDSSILSRTFCGSINYVSPEVLQGIPYDPLMYDIWSLGCVLFIMVTGSMPFSDSDTRDMLISQMKKEFDYPPIFNVNKAIKDLVSRMLEPDVTKRADMSEVSQSSWLKQTIKDSRSRSVDEDELSARYPTNSSSTSTQTDLLYRVHCSDECNCGKCSDDSN